MGKRRKRKGQPNPSVVAEEEARKNAPHSFIFHRGKVGQSVLQLVTDLRKVMEPYTAKQLQVQKHNNLKDFISVSKPLGVTHCVTLTRTEKGLNLRIFCVPQGPTLTFRIHQYTLVRDVISSQRVIAQGPQLYYEHPLLILNNFFLDPTKKYEARHILLMQTMFQNMFPTVNINNTKVGTMKRCVLVNYMPEKDQVEFRHYAIKIAPTGLSRSARKLLPNRKRIPNLSRYKDISDFFLKPEQLSESEYEEVNEVELPEAIPKKVCLEKSSQAGIRLVELGPRLTLELLKIEEGIATGEVLYHRYIRKTAAEKEEQRKKLEEKKLLKEARKKEQQENVKRKEKLTKQKHAGPTKKRVKFEIKEENDVNDGGEADFEDENDVDVKPFVKKESGRRIPKFKISKAKRSLIKK